MNITEDAKLRCVERELKMRRRNYPSFVERGILTREEADREIDLMTAIAEDYRKVVYGERLL